MDRIDLAVNAARQVVGLQRPAVVRAVVLPLMVVLDLQIAVVQQALRDDQVVRLVAARKQRRVGQPPADDAEDDRARQKDQNRRAGRAGAQFAGGRRLDSRPARRRRPTTDRAQARRPRAERAADREATAGTAPRADPGRTTGARRRRRGRPGPPRPDGGQPGDERHQQPPRRQQRHPNSSVRSAHDVEEPARTPEARRRHDERADPGRRARDGPGSGHQSRSPPAPRRRTIFQRLDNTVKSISPITQTDVAIVGAGAAGLATAIFTRRLNPARAVRAARRREKTGREDPRQRRLPLQRHQRVGDRDRFLGRQPIDDPPDPSRLSGSRHDRLLQGARRPAARGGRRQALPRFEPGARRARRAAARSGRVRRRAARRSPRARRRSLGPRVPDRDLARRVRRPPRSCSPPAASRCPRPAATAPATRSRGVSATRSSPTTPALVPLLLAADDGLHRELPGVAQEVELTVWVDGAAARRIAARSCGRTSASADRPRSTRRATGCAPGSRDATCGCRRICCPGLRFEDLDRRWTALAAERPKASVARARWRRSMPASAAAAVLRRLAIDAESRSRISRATIAGGSLRALVEWPLPVTGSRGYNYAEVTAGGVRALRDRPGDDGSRASVRGCSWSARFWTWTAASAASTSSGRGRPHGRPPSLLPRDVNVTTRPRFWSRVC